MDAVQCYVNCWDEHLVLIAGALWSAVNRNSGFTANKIMLGREFNTPADLLYPVPRRWDSVDVEVYTWWTLIEQALQLFNFRF